MVDSAMRDALKPIAIRGRIALVLTCIEQAITQCGVQDERIEELIDALWVFVEDPYLIDADERWRETQAADDLVDAVDQRLPVPDSYRDVPQFLAEAIYNALESATLYAGMPIDDDGNEENLDFIMNALMLLEQHDIAIPALQSFARLPFSEQSGWGRAVPRTFFHTAHTAASE